MMGHNEVCVPASSVEAGGGEGGEAVQPSEGDEVEVTLKGKVSRVEGGNVYFSPTEANGQPIDTGKSDSGAEPDSEDSMDAMMAGAKSDRDEGMGY